VAGFSLPEVLVALVIGLIGVVVMMQVFSMNEGQRRTATSGDDAIGTGSVTLFSIQRDIQRSGWGVSSPQLLGCTISGVAAGSVGIPLAPVIINSALIPSGDQDPDTDSLMIISGNGNGSVEGTNIEAIAGTQVTVHAAGTFRDNDSVVLAPRLRPASCGLTRDSVTSVVSPVVNLAVGPAGTSATIAAKDVLFNLGGALTSTAAPSVRVYRVRNQTLTVCDFVANNCSSTAAKDNPAVWVPLANNVVSLRAQYGRDSSSPMDGVLDVWDRTVPTPAANPLSPPNFAQGCAWSRISAVRLALVARSSQPEKLTESGDHVTANPLKWAGSDELAESLDATEAAAVAISLPSPNGTWPTWQDFRYKMFQTIVPLRNISTQGVPPEC
jgi:type IV pilus assembly protein PilW